MITKKINGIKRMIGYCSNNICSMKMSIIYIKGKGQEMRAKLSQEMLDAGWIKKQVRVSAKKRAKGDSGTRWYCKGCKKTKAGNSQYKPYPVTIVYKRENSPNENEAEMKAD